jgi:hypothetical protein
MADVFKKTDLASPLPEYTLEHRKDGLFDLFTIGDIEYRLGGIKPLFVTSLRVNIRARCGEKNYYDSLDLYLARGRTAFAASLGRSFGVEPDRVERDLLRLLENLEAERDKALAVTGAPYQELMSEVEKHAGMDLLTDPDLFTRIADDLSALGYVGEPINKQLLYLCATSRKRDNPINVMIISQSSGGKSYQIDCVRRLMPEEDVIAITSLSDQALNYMQSLEHKFLILNGAVHNEAVEQQMREMLSGKKLSRLIVEKDPASGRMESRMMTIKTVVSCVMGSTAESMDFEKAGMFFMIHADESTEQTDRIHEYQRMRRCLKNIIEEKNKTDRIISAHRSAQRLLRNIQVVNDFAPFLDFPTALMRTRRDHERFLDLIDTVCFLRQHQKQVKTKDGVQYISCDLYDYTIAYNIMANGVLVSTMDELPRGARLLYEKICAWLRNEAKEKKQPVKELKFTQRQVREATGLGHSWITEMLRLLTDYEYLVKVSGGGQRSKAWYSLRSDEGIAQADISMIPDPASLKSVLNFNQGIHNGKAG